MSICNDIWGIPFWETLGSGIFSFQGGHFGVGRFARGKGTQSYEARFSPSRSPFPGTSLFCVVICCSVLEMDLYSSVLVVWGLCRWGHGGRKAVCAADLFLVIVVALGPACSWMLLLLRYVPAYERCCCSGMFLLMDVVVARVCSCLWALLLLGYVPAYGRYCCSGMFLLMDVVIVQATAFFLSVTSQGTGPLRGPLSRPAEQKNRLSLSLPVQQHTGLNR